MNERPSRLPAALVLVVAMVVAFAAGALLFGDRGGPAGEQTAETAEVWTCSMHPQVRQPEPGSCPLCGMDLVPASSVSTGATGDMVMLSERARALARLRTTTVRRQGDATAQVRLLGRVEADERTLRNVTTWVGGRIDELEVDVTGERIRKGQVVATLYSPEVYEAHQDLITARQQVERLGEGTDAARAAAAAAFDAARERLRLLGVPDAELQAMATADSPTRAVPLRSAFGGTVIERLAVEGAYVETGTPLYRVADLSSLWVQLDAYESDLPMLSVGQSVALTVEALPGATFEGRVAFIDPTLDAARRTVEVRVEVDNRDGSLRPGMFAEAVVAATAEAPEGEAADAPLVIPASAPLFTGRRSIVYVEIEHEGAPAYVPREVRLGPRMGEVYPVVAGVSEGEKVVSRGAFVLDADLQIQGGASMMTADDDRADDGDAPVALGAKARAALAPVLQDYLAVQVALAEDDHAAATAAAGRIGPAVAAVELDGAAAAAWASLSPGLTMHARHVASATSIEDARMGFEHLSLSVETLLRVLGNPLDAPVHVAFCPMAMGSEGARWVQQGQVVDNAYYGAMMRRCGEIQAEIAPGGHLGGLPDAGKVVDHSGHEH